MRRNWLICSGVVLLFACVHAWASINRGTIQGTTTDPQGAVVPGVGVTVTNADTGVSQATKTNIAGFYLVPELVPGPYRVHFEMTGFVATEVTNVEVRANDVATVDTQLKLGATVQQVEVKALVPLVETTASNFSVPLERQYVEDLPLLGRDVQSLVQLIPGATQSLGPPGSLVGFNSQFGGFPDATHVSGSLVAVNGSQGGANAWYLDGNLNAAQGVDNVVVSPSPDAVSEFQAVNNAFAAEYGRNAGAVFSVVLKSGANNLHGDLYEFNRNSHFNARNPVPPNWFQFTKRWKGLRPCTSSWSAGRVLLAGIKIVGRRKLAHVEHGYGIKAIRWDARGETPVGI